MPKDIAIFFKIDVIYRKNGWTIIKNRFIIAGS